MRNKPRIRFKGFTEDWEQYKLEDICLYQSSSVTINDVDENGRYDLYDVNSLIGKTNKGFMEKEYITIIKDGAGVGRTRILPKNSMFLGTMGAITPQNSNLEFLYQLVTSANLGKICSGSTIPHIYFKDYGKLKFYIPSIIEQEVIGKIFYNIDNLITLHQRKLEKLKLAKKALLQKLFPKNGSQFPEIRFKGFTDAWEQRKLGALAEIVRGASPRPISDPKWFDNDSSVGWLRIADVTAQDGRIRYLEQKISELGQEKTRVIKTPHLLLSIAATVGKPVINYVPTGVHDGFLIFLNPKFNILYAFWWLDMFREKWNKDGQPGSQVNLNSDLVKNQVINIPNEKEQEKISSFLESLDKIITLHQRKLERLQEVKKGLLQKMFV